MEHSGLMVYMRARVWTICNILLQDILKVAAFEQNGLTAKEALPRLTSIAQRFYVALALDNQSPGVNRLRALLGCKVRYSFLNSYIMMLYPSSIHFFKLCVLW